MEYYILHGRKNEMEKIWEIFNEIAAIPHGSGNTKAISDYCLQYARARGFEAEQDKWNNVVIRLPATAGMEAHPAVVLQGHLDMVCEKEPESSHDFEKDPLKLRREGDWLMADQTTLGGDDGIAIAFGLALLEDPCPHPPMELFFTVDEETGLDGAINFDPALIRGRLLINVDSEEEGVLTVSAAGGVNAIAELPLKKEPCKLPVYEISVGGLQGGHSGAEIHQLRGNAIKILGKILKGLPCRLIAAEGGNKSNAIPRNARALVAMEQPADGAALTALFQREYGAREPQLEIKLATATADRMLTKECSDAAIALLSDLPDGVQEWSSEMEGLVETSLNAGILKTEEQALTLVTSLRSMKNAKRDALLEQVRAVAERSGAALRAESGYPAWEWREASPLRECFKRCYRALYQKDIEVMAIHAGLECGVLSDKLEGLDAVSIGPDMKDIHTPRERLSISSSERTYQLIKEVLKSL